MARGGLLPPPIPQGVTSPTVLPPNLLTMFEPENFILTDLTTAAGVHRSQPVHMLATLLKIKP